MYPRFRLSRAHKTVARTAGNLTIGNAWADLDGSGALDLVLPARVGDTIEVQLSSMWINTENSTGCLNVVTMVAGAAVSTFAPNGGTDYGVQSWIGPIAVRGAVAGSAFHTVVSGDLSGGLVTLRLQGRNDNAVSRVLAASAAQPLVFAAKNLGPAAS